MNASQFDAIGKGPLMKSKKNILLLHKNKREREQIAVYLRELDYSVATVNTIDDAYDFVHSMHPDLLLWAEVFTADAKKILRKIKRDKFGQKMPILAMIGDVELFDRIEFDKIGIQDILPLNAPLAEIRLKIKSHLKQQAKVLSLESEITRLRNISEMQYNISILNDLNRLCELTDDFLTNDYNLSFLINLVYNSKSGEYDYKNFINNDPDIKIAADAVLDNPLWKNYFFSSNFQTPGRVTEPELRKFIKSIGLNSEVYFQLPMYAHKKQIGVILCGCSLANAISDKNFNDLAVLINSVGYKIHALRKVYSREHQHFTKAKNIQNVFQQYNEDQIFEQLTRKILDNLGTDVCIYFNYNSGFHFLYPQFCFQNDSDLNLFDSEKPPVLMTKDYPNFSKFIASKKKSGVYNLTKNPAQDLAAIAELAGGIYNSIVIFSVDIGNEIKGFFVTANENSMKRFTSPTIRESEKLIQNATAILMESRLIKKAQQTIKQLDRVFDLGKELTLENHIDELLPKIVQAIRRTLGWNIVILDKKDPFDNNFQNVCYSGINKNVFESIQKKYPGTMYAHLKNNCFKQSNSSFLDHKYVQLQIMEKDEHRFQTMIGSEWNDRDWVFVPIRSHGRELGVISVNDPVDRLRPNDEKVRSLEYFANQAAVALENAALYQNLKNSEEKYKSLAETITMGLVTCDEHGGILYLNQSFAKIMGYSQVNTLLGRNIFDLIADKSRLEMERYVLYATQPKKRKDGDRTKFEDGLRIELLGNDNRFIPFKIYLTASLDSNDKSGFVAVLADLRPQQRIERLKADFNSMIVHDLRSPLNIVQGYIDIVRTKVVGDITEEQGELLGIAKENSFKVLNLVDNFLTASKLEVGQFDISPEVGSINALIETSYQNNKVLADQKKVKFKLNLPPSSPLLSFDKARIDQVLMNYISNALKFTPAGGVIEVGSKLANGKNDLTGDKMREIHVWVKDSGVGIEEKELSKVFNKYEQTEAGKDASLKGTGLGLAICKEVINLHKGKVWVESKPGEGSTFYFSLPVQV